MFYTLQSWILFLSCLFWTSEAPFAPTSPLQFCPYNGTVCCSNADDSSLSKQFKSMSISDPSCSSLLQSILCAVRKIVVVHNSFCSRILIFVRPSWWSKKIFHGLSRLHLSCTIIDQLCLVECCFVLFICLEEDKIMHWVSGYLIIYRGVINFQPSFSESTPVLDKFRCYVTLQCHQTRHNPNKPQATSAHKFGPLAAMSLFWTHPLPLHCKAELGHQRTRTPPNWQISGNRNRISAMPLGEHRTVDHHASMVHPSHWIIPQLHPLQVACA